MYLYEISCVFPGRQVLSTATRSCQHVAKPLDDAVIFASDVWSSKFLPSGNSGHSYGKWPMEIDGLPLKHGDFL